MRRGSPPQPIGLKGLQPRASSQELSALLLWRRPATGLEAESADQEDDGREDEHRHGGRGELEAWTAEHGRDTCVRDEPGDSGEREDERGKGESCEQEVAEGRRVRGKGRAQTRR